MYHIIKIMQKPINLIFSVKIVAGLILALQNIKTLLGAEFFEFFVFCGHFFFNCKIL